MHCILYNAHNLLSKLLYITNVIAFIIMCVLQRNQWAFLSTHNSSISNVILEGTTYP